MKRIVLTSLLSVLAMPALASQFDQLRQIEVQHEQAQAAERAAQLRQAEAARARQEAKEAAYRRNKLAAQERARLSALEQRKAEEAEEKRQRGRAERFEDEDRELELEERRLRLQALKAKAARANDYIDAELRESAAKTDVIQSEADSARNVTSAPTPLLQYTAAADINRATRVCANYAAPGGRPLKRGGRQPVRASFPGVCICHVIWLYWRAPWCWPAATKRLPRCLQSICMGDWRSIRR